MDSKLFKKPEVILLINFIMTLVIGCESLSEPEPPEAVTLIGAEEVTSSSLKLNWTENSDSDFSYYRIYRSSDYSVSENSTLVTTIYSRSQTNYTVTGISANTTYYFKIYVYNDDELSTGSNTISVTTAELVEIEEHTTDYEGKTSFNIGGYEVEIYATDEIGNTVSNVQVVASVTSNYLIVFAGTSSHYPLYNIEPLSGYLNKRNLTEEKVIEPITIYLIFKAFTLGYAIYDFLSETHIQDVLMEDDVTKRCITGDVNDLFNIITALDVFGVGGLIIQLSSQAASNLSTTVHALSFMSEILGDPDLFGVSLADGLNILDQDIGLYCWGEDESGFAFTPIYVESVELHRQFEYKFTLIWGENPRDLDSHLWTPSISGSSYHIYYDDMGSTDFSPYAELDVDDVQSYGPENISIKQFFSGTYYYSIHHYNDWEDDIGLITTSQASVKVLGPQGVIYNIDVPSGYAESGWWWNVFQINGSTGQISLINQISSEPPSGALAKLADWNINKK